MIRSLIACLIIGAVSLPLMAGTVIITSVPDESRGLGPLTSQNGVALAEATQMLVGAFPGLSDDQLLDLASQGAFTDVTEAFVPFGSPISIGQGVDGEAGFFEVAVKDSTSAAAWLGETVSLLIQPAGEEFLIARFPGRVFAGATATGLDPLLSLHLGDARVIVGNRVGAAKISTSVAPASGSYGTWLAQFTTISDPLLKLPEADADADGIPNFLEYATGGNPEVSGGAQPCSVIPDGEGGVWVRFSHVPGLGTVRYTLAYSDNLASPWREAAGAIEPDPVLPDVMRLRIQAPLAAAGYYRLNVD
jgi:hypothetical protein